MLLMMCLPTSIRFSRDGKVLLKGGGKKSYAKVLKPDIEWEGNVVHVISSVLLPEGFDAYEVRKGVRCVAWCHVTSPIPCFWSWFMNHEALRRAQCLCGLTCHQGNTRAGGIDVLHTGLLREPEVHQDRPKVLERHQCWRHSVRCHCVCSNRQGMLVQSKCACVCVCM